MKTAMYFVIILVGLTVIADWASFENKEEKQRVAYNEMLQQEKILMESWDKIHAIGDRQFDGSYEPKEPQDKERLEQLLEEKEGLRQEYVFLRRRFESMMPVSNQQHASLRVGNNN